MLYDAADQEVRRGGGRKQRGRWKHMGGGAGGVGGVEWRGGGCRGQVERPECTGDDSVNKGHREGGASGCGGTDEGGGVKGHGGFCDGKEVVGAV